MPAPQPPTPRFVAPVPVYGVEQADGSIARPRTVAEGAAAARARADAVAGLHGSPSWRRASAGLVDLAVGLAVAYGVDAAQPTSLTMLVVAALGTTLLIRLVVGTVADGATPGRSLMGLRAVHKDGARIGLLRVAARDASLILAAAVFPLWLYGRLVWAGRNSPLGEVGPSYVLRPVPQDDWTGTTVASVAEVRRVRERTARRGAAVRPLT